jgi:ubiquinone/menaquinone biosynthesis C-methylase UbiE
MNENRAETPGGASPAEAPHAEAPPGGVPAADVWSEWLLHHRHADDDAYAEAVRNAVNGYADRVLDAARLAAGMVLADVGSGDGLVAFRAIERIGPSLRVILTDVSAPLLAHAAALAAQRGVRAQCEFHCCAADALAPLADASVDVVATRAALAYVADKRAALREFHRVLKPGGRISLCEPVMQDEAFYVRALKRSIETPGPRPPDRFTVLLHRWKAAQYPDTAELCAQSPIVNYSERDLFNFIQAAGFDTIHVELHIDVLPPFTRSWAVFLRTSPHPWAPTLGSILATHFTAEEREFFERIARPAVESGSNVTTERIVYAGARRRPD